MAQVQYRSGPVVYTPAIDFVTGFTSNGTGYFVSQAYIPTPPQPTVGQSYYVSVYMSGIAAPAAGRLMAVHFVPPSGTTVVSDAGAPVRCFYKAMDGSGSQVEFTNQVITDNSFNANLRIFGCPQPPYSVVAVPNGTAFLFDRRDPLRQGQFTWPMGSYATYEFLIPVTSNRTMDGFSTGDRFIAPIQSIQGDGIDPWANPQLSLLVSPPSAGPSADLGHVAAAPPPPSATRVSIGTLCRNFGPSVAQNVSCGFTDIPAGLAASVTCSPTSPQATLAVGAQIGCSLGLNKFVGTRTVTAVVSSSTSDPVITNNSVVLTINGGLSNLILSTGFEDPQ